MSKVVQEGFIRVPRSESNMVLFELPNHIEPTRIEQGCSAFRTEGQEDNPLESRIKEAFSSNEVFEAHQARVRASQRGKATADGIDTNLCQRDGCGRSQSDLRARARAGRALATHNR